MAWFSWTNHNSSLRITINEIASFCIDNRLRRMAFFVFAEVGKGRLSLKNFEIRKALSELVCFVIIYNIDRTLRAL